MKHVILSTIAICTLFFATSCPESKDTTPKATYGTISYGSNSFTIEDVLETNNTTLYNLAGDGSTGTGSFAMDVVVDTIPTANKEYSIGTGNTRMVHVSTSVGSTPGDNLNFGKAGEKISATLVHGKVMLAFTNLTEVDQLGVPKSGSSLKLTGAIMAK